MEIFADHHCYPKSQAEVPFLVEDLIFCSKVNKYSNLVQFQSFWTLTENSIEIPFLVEELEFCSKVPNIPNYFQASVNHDGNKRKLDRIDEELSATLPERSEISLGRFASSRSRYDKNSAVAYRCKSLNLCSNRADPEKIRKLSCNIWSKLWKNG